VIKNRIFITKYNQLKREREREREKSFMRQELVVTSAGRAEAQLLWDKNVSSRYFCFSSKTKRIK
jgi:hypothetical protein